MRNKKTKSERQQEAYDDMPELKIADHKGAACPDCGATEFFEYGKRKVGGNVHLKCRCKRVLYQGGKHRYRKLNYCGNPAEHLAEATREDVTDSPDIDAELSVKKSSPRAPGPARRRRRK